MKEKTFIKTIWEAIAKACKEYKEHKKAVKSKKDLLSSKSDFRLLEKMIQEVNNDPQLEVSVVLNDGTKIKIFSWANYGQEKEKLEGRIDGTLYDTDGNIIIIK